MEVTQPRAKLEMSGLAGFTDLAPDLALGDGDTLLNRLAKKPGLGRVPAGNPISYVSGRGSLAAMLDEHTT